MITKFIFLALVIFFGFRFLYFLNKVFHYPKFIKHHISYIIPVFELFSWIGILVGVVSYFYHIKRINLLILIFIGVLLLAVPAFFLLRDFIFGVYLKIQRRFEKGDFIEFEAFQGEIIEAGFFNLDIKDAQGDIKSIPYHKLRSKIITRHGVNPNLKKQILTFRFSGHLNSIDLQDELKKQMLNSPWVSISQPPFIESVKHDRDEHSIEVAVFTLKNEHAAYIQEMVEKSMKFD